MKIGLHLSNYTWPGGAPELGARLAQIGRAADDAGLASLWVSDHFFQIPAEGGSDREMLESGSALAYLAAATRRIRLGTLVSGVTYRNPGILVKGVTTLDVLSGGRAWFGVGAAWYKREHTGLGIALPSLPERFERLEETLRIAKQMWSDDDGRFEGRHYRLKRTICVPQPISRPHPPILIGGDGEKRTLRLVARYADACNLLAHVGSDVMRHKLDVLRRHCDDVGRDYDAIERTALGTLHLAPGAATAGDAVRMCREWAGAGIQQAILILRNVGEVAPVEVLGKEVVPEVAGF